MKVVIAFLINTLFNFVIGLLVAKFLGPEQFGRFALTLAVGLLLQTILFDWIRLAAVRFYSERARTAQPELRATLDAVFAMMATLGAGVAVCVMLSGIKLQLSNALIGLAATASITNGLFDYSTALVRARFHDGLYTRLMVIKNLLALALTTGGAYVFGSANLALVGVCLSVGGSVLMVRRSLADDEARPQLAQLALARDCLRYSLPIVSANALYLLIPLVNRSLVAARFGFGESGQFSLAFDLGARIVAALGSTLDVLLFQIAVRAEELHGAERAREQVGRNIAIILMVLAPACVGLWLVLPSLESVLVPQEFRGPFGRYLTLLLPGLFCFGMMSFSINPIFQIRKSTAPMIAAAVVACLVDGGFAVFSPRGSDASSFAVAQAASLAAALATLIVFSMATKPKWPSLRDLATIGIGSAAMTFAVLPLRKHAPGVATFVEEGVIGAAIYAAIVIAFDTAGMRTLIVGLTAARKRGGFSTDAADIEAEMDQQPQPDHLAG